MGKKRDNKEEEKKKKKNGRMSCCEREGLKRGAWTPEEDKILVEFITQNGHGTWRNLPKLAGLHRCGKSCRLRWTNYLRPDIKRGPFSPDEENTIIQLHETFGNKWAAIASHLPGRTDNDVKNFWNSHLRKRFSDKITDQPSPSSKPSDAKLPTKCPLTRHMTQWESVRLEAESRLSVKPLPLYSPSATTSVQGDYFVSLWNSEIGQSFRNINESDRASNSHSPTSQTSSVTKVESSRKTGSGEMYGGKSENWKCKKEMDDVAVYSDMTSKPYDEVDDSSDEMLEMLLDFPVGENDMGFLHGNIGDVSTYV
ncbi:hypothetical protein OROMI_027261 [Orobanche minor]